MENLKSIQPLSLNELITIEGGVTFAYRVGQIFRIMGKCMEGPVQGMTELWLTEAVNR